jgi:hypothetical protein
VQHLGSQDAVEMPPSKRWEVRSAGAIYSVLALLGVALGGSIAAALLILARFAADDRIEVIGVLLLAALLLSAICMSKIIYEICCPRRRGSSQLKDHFR